MSRVIAVASGKGGAGKTSVAVNLAFALARRGKSVCLLDADLGLSNVDILLGIAPKVTLEDVLFDSAPLASALTPAGSGVDVIAGSSGVSRMAELTRPARARLAEQCAQFLSHDYLLVDNSPGISRQVVGLCLACSELAMVVNPEAASITDAYALTKVLSENGLTRAPLFIFNRTTGEAQAKAVFERLKQAMAKHLRLSARYLGQIPRDAAMSAAAAKQLPLAQYAPASKAARAFMELAAAIEAEDLAAPTRLRESAEFFNQSAIRLLEAPPERTIAPRKNAAADRRDARILAELAVARRLLDLVRQYPKTRLEIGFNEIDKRLVAAQALLGDGEIPAHESGEASARGGGKIAAGKGGDIVAGKSGEIAAGKGGNGARQRPPAPVVLLAGAEPNLAEVLSEALGRAGFAITIWAGFDAPPQAAVAILCRDHRRLAAIPGQADGLAERIFRLAGTIPIILADTGLGGTDTPAEPRAALTLPAPLRLDALASAVRSLAAKTNAATA